MKFIALIILIGMFGCKQKSEKAEIIQIMRINIVDDRKPLKYKIYRQDKGYYWKAQMPFYESNDPHEIPHIEWTIYVLKFKTYEEAKKDFESHNPQREDGHTGLKFMDEGYTWELVNP